MISSIKTNIPFCKRIFDIAIALICLVVLSPLMILIALLVLIKLGSPVFFRQIRPGYKERLFSIYKFRTMLDSKDASGNLLSDEERLTSFGRFLRASSLDELPEIFNIIKGEMSWVGPRPLLISYLPLYSSEQTRRHDVLPGLTGWAQVNGRNALSWEEKFKLDVWYVDHWSFWLDLKIIILTIWKIVKREGINQPGHATAELFQGSKEIYPNDANEADIKARGMD